MTPFMNAYINGQKDVIKLSGKNGKNTFSILDIWSVKNTFNLKSRVGKYRTEMWAWQLFVSVTAYLF